MYQADMHPDERDKYREAVRASLYKSSASKQKSLKNMFKGGSIKETMGRLISKFFIYESVPPQKVDSHHFKNMIFGTQQTGLSNCIICFTLLSPYEICFNNQLSLNYYM